MWRIVSYLSLIWMILYALVLLWVAFLPPDNGGGFVMVMTFPLSLVTFPIFDLNLEDGTPLPREASLVCVFFGLIYVWVFYQLFRRTKHWADKSQGSKSLSTRI